MAIINRDLSTSEQRTTFEFYSNGAIATGVTGIVCIVPYPCSVDGLQVASFGVSGTPTVQLIVNRFTPGNGATPTIGLSTFNIGSTYALISFGTSGTGALGTSVNPLNVSLPIIGSTTTQLLANDVIMFQTGGTASAVTGLGIELVIRPVNDHTKFFGMI